MRALGQVIKQTQIAYWKTVKKNYNSELVITSSATILEFHHNFITDVKFNHLKISSENSLHLVKTWGRRFKLRQNFVRKNVA